MGPGKAFFSEIIDRERAIYSNIISILHGITKQVSLSYINIVQAQEAL